MGGGGQAEDGGDDQGDGVAGGGVEEGVVCEAVDHAADDDGDAQRGGGRFAAGAGFARSRAAPRQRPSALAGAGDVRSRERSSKAMVVT